MTPKIDPAMEFEEGFSYAFLGLNLWKFEDDEGPVLPKSNSEEFRPFMRRLPEFKFWYFGNFEIIFKFVF